MARYRIDLEDGNWVILDKKDKDSDLECHSSWGGPINFTIKDEQLSEYLERWKAYAKANKQKLNEFDKIATSMGFKRL